jgi:hypothetical protein
VEMKRLITSWISVITLLGAGLASALQIGNASAQETTGVFWEAVRSGGMFYGYYPADLKVDKNGDVLVLMQGSDGTGDFVRPKVHVVKYSAKDGSQLWSTPFDAFGDDNYPAKMQVDSNNDVIFAGFSFKTATDGREINGVVAKYRGSDGALLWSATHRVTGFTYFFDLALDANGDVIVAGTAGGGLLTSVLVAKYKGSSGSLVWTKNDLGIIPNVYDSAIAVAVDANGDAYVAGTTLVGFNNQYLVVKYAGSSGNTLWRVSNINLSAVESIPAAIAVSPGGKVFVTGTRINFTTVSGASLYNGDFATVRLNPADGQVVWTATYDGGGSGVSHDLATSMAIDGLENVYITGAARWNFGDYATVKYDATNGARLWSATYDSGSQDSPAAIGLSADQKYVYITGSSYRNATNHDFVTIYYDAQNGNQQIVHRHDNATARNIAVAIGVSSANHIFVTGITSNWDNAAGWPVQYTNTIRIDRPKAPPSRVGQLGAIFEGLRRCVVVDFDGTTPTSISRCPGIPGCWFCSQNARMDTWALMSYPVREEKVEAPSRSLPKGQTKSAMRIDLETYLREIRKAVSPGARK